MKQQLFDKVFKNIVIYRTIKKYVRLYKKNQLIVFSDKKQLLGYKEREYLSGLIYKGKEMLEVGDLPINGILKSVEFATKELSPITGNAIPFGVEELKFVFSKKSYKEINYSKDHFSTFPSTINTIHNIIIKILYYNTRESTDEIHFFIPPNITSISFLDCPNFSNPCFKIPNTVKRLKFSQYWDNGNKPLNKEDLPRGLTYFSMDGFQQFQLEDNILPTSIKELSLSSKKSYNYIEYKFDFTFIHHLDKLESLYFSFHNDQIVTPEFNLSNPCCNSIKKLILIGSKTFFGIKPNSLPFNITELSLYGISEPIEVGSIPNNVSNLSIRFGFIVPIDKMENLISEGAIPNSVTQFTTDRIITQLNVLPSSIIHFQLSYTQNVNTDHDEYNKMISILPQSLKVITLSIGIKKLNLQFPQSVIVKYNDI